MIESVAQVAERDETEDRDACEEREDPEKEGEAPDFRRVVS